MAVNRTLALAIVANCWSTPIVHVVFRRDDQRSVRKLAVLLLDVLLDFVSSVVGPVAIFAGYLRDFNMDDEDFPLLNYYDDTWFIRAVAENQQVFVMSWLDLVTKILPSFTLLSAVRSLKATIHKQYSTSMHPHKKATEDDRPQSSTVTSPKRWIVRTAELGFVLWGILVLSTPLPSPFCTILMDVYSRCARGSPLSTTVSSSSSIANDWATVWTSTTCSLHWLPRDSANSSSHLVYFAGCLHNCKHCPIFSCSKCTIPPAEWSTDAALVHSVHKCIQFVYLVDTNLSRIPDGLLSPEFPLSLSDIEISGTNLSILPTNLHQVWGIDGFLDFFVFENVYDGLAEVPDSLHSLRVRHLSLCANGLKTLPERLFWANSTIEMLDLSSNPLTTLPKRSDMTDSPSTPLWELHVEFSGIKTLPEWLHTVSSSFYSLEARHYVKTLDLWRSW